MAEYEKMIGKYNLARQVGGIENATGSSDFIPYFPNMANYPNRKDADGNWVVTYTFFDTRNATIDPTANGGKGQLNGGSNLETSYYQYELAHGDLFGMVSNAGQHKVYAKDIMVGANYNLAIQHKILDIVNDTNLWTASFNNTIKIKFIDPAPAGSAEIGQIAIGQIKLSHPASVPAGASASTRPYVDTIDPATGSPFLGANLAASDIFFFAAHDDPSQGTAYHNLWTNIYTGTAGYKAIYEELSHALGIEAMDVGLPQDKQTQKYSVTAYKAYGGVEHPGDPVVTEDTNTRTMVLYRPNHNGLPAYEVLNAYGLQLYDMAALQKIYGRDYTARASGTTPNTTYALGAGLGRDNSDGTVNSADKLNAFIYTIWDGGGKDRIDVSGFGDISAKIDLRQGEFSSIGTNGITAQFIGSNGTMLESLGLFRWVVEDDGKINYFRDAGNVAIAYHTVIEDAVGSSSHDVIIGNAWQNTLWGGAGNDYIFGDGNSYRENLNDADASQDSGQGYVYTDTLDPNDPNRAVPAPPSDTDVIYGGDGNDHLFGGEGNDTLYGGNGNDRLFGGKGNDSLLGEYGNDVFFVDPTLFGTEHDVYNGGHASVTAYNHDTMDYSKVGQTTPWSDSFGLNIDLSLTDTSSGGYTRKNGSTVDIDKLYSIESVALTQQNDTLKGSSSDNIFAALGGDDHFVATRGSDLYHGGYNPSQMPSDWYVQGIDPIATTADGHDTIDYTNANAYFDVTVIDKDAGIYWVDKYYGNSIHNGVNERDYLYSIDEITGTDKSGAAIQICRIREDAGGTPVNGNANPNSLSYGAAPNAAYTFNGYGGNDTITGGTQNDRLIGGAGNDTLSGGDGHDMYVYNLGDGNDRIQDGGTSKDVDTLKFGTMITPADVTLTRGADNNVLVNIVGGSTILLYAQNYTNPIDYIKFESDGTIWDMQGTLVEVKGTTGNDSLMGTFSSAYREGSLIDDKIDGGAGNDNIDGLQGRDTLIGGSGLDTISGWSGADIIYGGDDSDWLSGDSENDTILGENGNDTLYGGDGDDTLYGGEGNDFLRGDAGSDVFYGGKGDDTLVCNVNGADTVVFKYATTFDANGNVLGVDTIQSFSVTAGMSIDLSDLLAQQLVGYNPYQTGAAGTPASNKDSISDFVSVTESNGNSYLYFDRDGDGDGSATPQQIAVFTNTTGLMNVDYLESIGTLITFPKT